MCGGALGPDETLYERSLAAGQRAYRKFIRELTERIRATETAEQFEAEILNGIRSAEFQTGLGASLARGTVAALSEGRSAAEETRNSKLQTSNLNADSGRVAAIGLNHGSAGSQKDSGGVSDHRSAGAINRPLPNSLIAGARGEEWRYDGPLIESDFFRLRSFTIAHVDNQRILDELKAELQKVLDGGGSYGDFRGKITDLLGNTISDWHAETIFRTNLQTAYNAGKYYEGQRAADVLPYWRYRTAEDDRVRPAHALMSGRVYRKDDPIWAEWFPPNGYQCRCSVDEYDDFALEADGLRVSQTIPAGAVPDRGFARNAATDPTLLQKLIEDYGARELNAAEYGLDKLQTQNFKLKTPPPIPPAEAEGNRTLPDESGQERIIPAEVLSAVGSNDWMIATTLRDPQEIWGWPGRELYYIAVYETAEGVQTCAVKVWGEVRDAVIVAGTGEEFRVGMLIRKG